MTPISPDVFVALWLLIAAFAGAALFYINRPRRHPGPMDKPAPKRRRVQFKTP